MIQSPTKKATSRVYSKVRIGLASPEVILDWSYGEVLKPETINYRSLKPEKDGLFCEKIFGTTKDWECNCGKFKSIRYKGIICDRCGVEITHSKVRRERMGHIKLSVPVAHIWFYKSVPSRIGLLLDLSIFAIKSIIYCEQYIVLDPGEVKDIKKHELITEDRYYELREEHGKKFRAGTGAEVLQEMLEELDLDGEAIQLREKMNASGKTLDKRKMVRLGLIEDFIDSSNRPEWMVLQAVPVIPADLRPMVQLEGGRFATSDLNDLYRRLINRNNRLKKLMALKAPDVIIKNEKRMLQEAVDALFDNSKRKRAFKGVGNRTLKSLSDILKGKQGRFRQNLLGKRVDYSARSVIVVGPELKLYQCGLPRKMALELFKPFIMRRMVERKYVYNIKSAKRLIDNEYPEVWNLLEETVKGHPVILNRAPTLHRLGMQAFEPILTNEKAIRLHPLVCSAYNADFDGDQMAVHIPLSAEAQIEAWTLMLSSLNLLDPANGEPVMNPSQDMILGYYNLTNYKEGELGEGKYFGSVVEAKKAYENRVVGLQAKIRVAYPNKAATLSERTEENKTGKKKKSSKSKTTNFPPLRVMKETSVGRIIFSEALPAGIEIPDKALVDKDVLTLIKKTHEKYGNYITAGMLDQLKQIGFHYSTIFSNTISLEDILIPEQKASIVANTHKQANDNNQNYQKGIITEQERYQKNISLWTYANDVITQHMMEQLSRDQKGHNSLYIMASSGARGSKQQIRQLAGMRGLMAKPSGDIIDMPIISNFKEGLQVLEYFISTHGARKGLSDTALKTADAGYLTRKLVDTAQDVTVVMDDCGTISGIDISPIKSGGEIIERLSERVLGRFSAEAIIDPFTDSVILEADREITPKVAELVDKAEMSKVKIRTVVTCEAPLGICRKCYGINLAQSKMVDIGEAVGVVASQSIGQPGTQLTMRTFHVGGTASSEVKDPDFKATSDLMIVKLPDILLHNQEKELVAPRRGFVSLAMVFDKFPQANFKKITVKNGQRVSINSEIGLTKKGQSITVKKPGFVHFDEANKLLLHIGIPYQHPVEVGAVFKKEQAELIQRGKVIYSFDTVTEPIIAEESGTVRFQDIILNKTLREEYDEYTTAINYKIINSKEEHLQPKLIIVSTEKIPGEETPKTIELDLPVDSNLYIKDGEKVFKGDILAGRIRSAQKTVDITGGLPRVQELFEARNPTNAAIIAEIDGEVEVGETRKGRRTIFVKNAFSEKVEHVVPTGKALTVRNGDLVMAGEPLCEGMLNPHDVLRVNGEIDLYRFILKNVQEIYKRQGVNINDKHIGVIVRQMLRKVEIVDSGDTSYIVGDLVDKYRLRQKNEEVIKEGGQPAVVKSVLLGLTKASLRTDSFISSAAFQETTKVLATEAIKNSYDELRGLKENVIIGQKIPAGTGKEDYEQLKVYRKFVGDLDYVLMEEEE